MVNRRAKHDAFESRAKGAKGTVIVNMSLFISEDVKRHRTLTGAWCVACVMATKHRRMY